MRETEKLEKCVSVFQISCTCICGTSQVLQKKKQESRSIIVYSKQKDANVSEEYVRGKVRNLDEQRTSISAQREREREKKGHVRVRLEISSICTDVD